MKKLLLFSAVLAVSCSADRIAGTSAPDGERTIIKAFLPSESTPTHKTSVSEEGKVLWLPGDEIAVFCGGNKGKFTSTLASAAESGEFSGAMGVTEGDELWALYPYREDASFDNGVITTTLPAEQEAVSGGVQDDLLITLGHANSLSVPFYNVCSGFRFTLKSDGVLAIKITTRNDYPIAGRFRVKVGDDGKPLVEGVSDPSRSILLKAPGGGTFTAGEWYYFVTLPVESMLAGFTYEFYTEDSWGLGAKQGTYEFRRGVFLQAPKVDNTADVYTYAQTPLCIEPLEDVVVTKGSTVKYRIEDKTAFLMGSSWTSDGSTSVEVSSSQRLYLCYDSSNPSPLGISGDCQVFGNPLSMTKYTANNFKGCGGLVSDLSDQTLYRLFYNCTHLLNHPFKKIVLPAPKLGTLYIGGKYAGAYEEMFAGCTSLTTAPDLPATRISNACYAGMFEGCTSLVNVPDILPMTDNINAAQYIYHGMFKNCTSLERAPELPLLRIPVRGYEDMFLGCSNLKYIKMTATVAQDYSLDNWIDGISPTGTFVMNNDAEWDPYVDLGVPEGWTIIRE